MDQNLTDIAPGPRILQLLPALAREEPVQAALGLVRPLVASGGVVVVGSVGGRLEPQLERAGGKLVRLQPPHLLDFGKSPNLKTLKTCCADHQLQVIHAHGVEQARLGTSLAAATGLPLVVSCSELPGRGSLSAYLKRRNLAKARRVVAASSHISEQVTKLVPRLTSPVSTIPHGINVEAFDEAAVTTARTISLAEVWGVIEDPRPIILVSAPPDNNQWPDRICNIVSQTVQQNSGALDAQFVLIGEDQGTGRAARLERKLAASGLTAFVRFAGHCADPEAALKLASLVLSFSHSPSGVCYTALQAQAMGRPVVLGNSGAAAEAIEDGVTGWLVSPDQPDQVARCILQALAMDESARAHLALAARARIVSSNSASVMNQRLLALYEDLVQAVGTA